METESFSRRNSRTQIVTNVRMRKKSKKSEEHVIYFFFGESFSFPFLSKSKLNAKNMCNRATECLRVLNRQFILQLLFEVKAKSDGITIRKKRS